jgi:type IV pilus assembly protein PilX
MDRDVMKNQSPDSAYPRQQQGIAFFMSLVILLIMTVLGVSSVQTTRMQEMMARNSHDINIAFLAAESAMKDAEALIEATASVAQFTAVDAYKDGLYLEADYNAANNWSQVDWSASNGNYVTAATAVDGVAEPPKYIVEHLKSIVSSEDTLNMDNIGQGTGSGLSEVFRITAYGTGGSVDAHVLIQSTSGKRF